MLRLEIKELYSIGQISKICEISIQTLRYYDNIGLLKPTLTNNENGYRYYAHKQIMYIKIIQQLRDFDFSLKEIKKFLERDDFSVILRLLIQKKLEVKEKIANLEDIENQLSNHIKNLQIVNEADTSTYIELKNLPARVVAFTRYHSPCNPDVFSMRYNELLSIIRKNNWIMEGNLMATFYDHYTVFDYNNADIEVCVQIKPPKKDSGYVRTIPKGLYLTSLHHGPYDGHVKTYTSMLEWIQKNEYKIVGPSTEKYIIDMLYTKNPKNFITELQLPVKKS